MEHTQMEESQNSSRGDALSSCSSIHMNRVDFDAIREGHMAKLQLEQGRQQRNSPRVDRQWVTLTEHQPVDTVTRYVDVPVKQTRIVRQPKVEVVEKIREVPNYSMQYANRIVEVPEVQLQEKRVEVPYNVERLRYVPKEIIKYNTIRKPVQHPVIRERRVNVLNVEERVAYRPQEMVEEVYTHFDPDQSKFMDHEGNTIYNESEPDSHRQNEFASFDNPRYQYVNDNNTLPPILAPFGPQIKLPQNSVLEKVFIPKTEKVVELEKRIDIPIDCPVPYIVPKPKIIDVKVPVFKFNDTYTPVPIKRKVIPKITWTKEVYQVDCVIEKPYLVYENIVKIVPTDSKITVSEYPTGITRIEPQDLSEMDNLTLWMRVNANLKQEKDREEKERREQGVKEEESSYSCNCSETNMTDRTSTDDLCESKETIEDGGCPPGSIPAGGDQGCGTVPLHPGHPLNIVQLQNQWIHANTTKTQDLYRNQFLEAHHNAYFNMQTHFPREAELEAKQIWALHEQARNKELQNQQRQANSFVN